MIQNAADNQSKLLTVINELFTYVIDPYSGKKAIRVNPKLTEDLLQKAVEKTRRFIVDLYIKCENDYVNGVKLYEAIVESKIFETTQKQIETLKLQASKIIQETKSVSAPVIAPVPVVAPVVAPVIVPVVAPVVPVVAPLPVVPTISTPSISSSIPTATISGITQPATNSLPTSNTP